MKIFSAEQIRAWDQYTIRHEPISSIDLMERAARACKDHLLNYFPKTTAYHIVCGPGNNGGDGLAIARLLFEAGQSVFVYVPAEGSSSEDQRLNLSRWKNIPGQIQHLSDFTRQAPQAESVIIDALFGTGNLRKIDGAFKGVIDHINASGCTVVSIDLPSGLRADEPTFDQSVVRANLTLTLGCWKLGLLMPENGPFTGDVVCLPIGLHPDFPALTATPFEITTPEDLRPLIHPRHLFAHKGDFGTALLVAGSKHMMGAALLSAGACLRAGIGKLYCRVPASGTLAMQTVVPEAICLPDTAEDFVGSLPNDINFDAIGIGPGLGQTEMSYQVVQQVLEQSSIPKVIDADALNIISKQGWQEKLGRNTVITPHLGEFHRLFGPKNNGFSRIKAALEFSTSREVCIIIKGHFSFLSTPGGHGYFNPTGNPGMAKAGIGDVLTGIILALIAQKHSVDEACRLAMYIHGLCGDLASEELGQHAILASDLSLRIGKAIEAILAK